MLLSKDKTLFLTGGSSLTASSSGIPTATSAFDMSGQDSSENSSTSSRPGTSTGPDQENNSQAALGATASASGMWGGVKTKTS